MASKSEHEGTFALLNTNGRVRLTLMGILACTLLVFGFILLLQSPAQAWVAKAKSCSSASCHGNTNAGTVLNVSVNGSSGTSVTVAPGGTFELDWTFTNLPNGYGVNPEVAVPTGWTVAIGTANSPSVTDGWNTAWDAADGVSWNTTYSVSGEFPNSPVGYSINYGGTPWESGRNSAFDDGSTSNPGDRDQTANKMGTDARITVPAGTSPGTYSVMVLGIGHAASGRAHVEQTITVTVASGTNQATLSVTGPSSVTYGSTGTITTSGGSGTGAMSYSHGASTGCTVNSSNGVISVNNASGTCSVTATKAGDGTYNPTTSAPFTVTLNKATPTLSIGNPTVTYNGLAQAATVNGSVAGSATSFQYNGSGTVPTNAAIYTVTANFTPTDTNNYNSLTAASAGSFTINKATPTASVTNSPVTYDGSAKAASVSCLGGGTASNILTGGTATKTSAGTYAVTADCAASTNYSAASGLAAGNFIINKATPTLSVTNSPVVYDGSAKSAVVSGSVAGTPSSILTGGAASQTAVGTYAVTANFTPTDTTNYNSLTAASAGNFVISAATQTASVTNSPVIYNTAPQSAAVTCSGAGAVSNVRYNGSGTVPTNAATYAIVVDCAANGGFSATSNVAAGNFIINSADQAIGTITFTPASLVVSGTTTVSATATSGLTVNFSSNTEAVCTVSGSTVTGVSAGTCTIKAIQAGNGNFNAAPDATQSLEVTGGSSNVTLTVTLAGTGSGTVNSVPSGAIACPGDCSELYASGAEVTLTATPAAMATFAGWSGGSCSGIGDCVFNITADSGVTATFDPSPLVMLPGPFFYATIQDAYSAAVADAVLKVRNQTFSENLVFNGANVTFDGGYDALWAVGGFTTIHGDVTITNGGITVSNMIIE